MFPDRHIRGDAVFAVVEQHDPVVRELTRWRFIVVEYLIGCKGRARKVGPLTFRPDPSILQRKSQSP